MPVRARTSRTIAVVAALCAALVATACGSASPPAEGPQRVHLVDPYGGDPAKEGDPQRGGTLVIGNDREIISFDPTRQNANLAALGVYDSLLKLMPDGSAQPYLAKSMSTSDDGTTWTLGLREGVRFSDGTPLDANAVVVNTQRHIDKAASPAHVYAMQIASMTAVDPLTVRFTLKAPLGDFPTVFAQPLSSGTLGMIISPAALTRYGDDIGNHPVGAGPFVLTSWVRDNKMELVRNPDYWQQGKPYLDGVEIRPLPDTDSRYTTMTNGDVDMINGGFNQELVRAFTNPDLRVYYGPGSGGVLNYFNVTKAPFDDPRMRAAAVAAMDPQALGASFFSNQLVAADSLFDGSTRWHTPAASDAYPRYDQARAKDLVAQYVASGGDPTFSYFTDRSSVPLGEFVQASMAAVGVTVHVQYFDLAQFAGNVLQAGDFQMASGLSAFDHPFPGAGRIVQTGGSVNYGKYSNPQVDTLLADAAATTDPDRRASDYQQVELAVNKDLPIQWLSRSYLSTITKPSVKGVDRYVTRDLYFAGMWKEQS
ncbi:ABC-type transporter, periplasmic subunit [Pseudonocardia dioxanivorans CB1190]|uniref:ABC-type transporter, periplasmic subunit n=1 Tax=Pseudonocardia dioxanivorans (strain ATCC 55486 / DSM 44775 / JCM 13855 / CB1190) TaxID=675635 RepID=F4CJD5_PSEUX|nr:ABC transporter substrate-binding protein [Pseudonocardia dioxanivorans]AEA24887.1 ABC-type transporter, periplasmic subunit [Pseudonocardia dioxanivorans CB1190]